MIAFSFRLEISNGQMRKFLTWKTFWFMLSISSIFWKILNKTFYLKDRTYNKKIFSNDSIRKGITNRPPSRKAWIRTFFKSKTFPVAHLICQVRKKTPSLLEVNFFHNKSIRLINFVFVFHGNSLSDVPARQHCHVKTMLKYFCVSTEAFTWGTSLDFCMFVCHERL